MYFYEIHCHTAETSRCGQSSAHDMMAAYKEKGFTGVAIYENGTYNYFKQPLLENSCHGTGDIYASAFVGAYFNGKTAKEAAEIAAIYTAECIKATPKSHWYGACFEGCLIKLINLINA